MSTILENQEALWLGALAAAPVALLVAALCRGIDRPGTRHVMWCLALLSFVVPGVLLATGWTATIDGAVRDVPRAIASAFPPERAEWTEPGGPAAVEDGASPSTGTPAAADERAADVDRGGSEVSQSPPRSVTSPDRGVGPAGMDAVEIRPRPGTTPAPEPASGPRSARGVERPTRRASEEPAAANHPALLPPRGSIDASVEDEIGVLANFAASDAPSRTPARPVAPVLEGISPTTARAVGAALAGDPRPDVEAAAPATAASAPDARVRLTPVIRDPILIGLRSAGEGLAAWMESIGAAAASVVEIPAPPAALWVSGIVLILTIGSARALAGRAAVRRVTPVDRTDRRLVEDLSERLGLARAPRAYLVRSRLSPMVCGWLNPRIVLPEALWRSLDLDGRRAVLTHELAHLARRDQWVRLIELVVGVVYWWHPVLWAIRRRIREEADLCCDAWVTTLFPGLRRAYAEALLRTRVYLSVPGAVAPVAGLGMASARSRRFSRRLTMVMTGQNRAKASPLGVALAVAVGTVALVVAPSLAHSSLAKKGDRCPPETTAIVSGSGQATGGVVSTTAGPVASHNHAGHAEVHSAEHAPEHSLTHARTHGGGLASTNPFGTAQRHYVDTRALPASAPSGVYVGSTTSMPRPAGDAGVDARLRAMEARLDRIDAMLQRLLERSGAGAGGPASSAPTLAPSVVYQSLLQSPQFELAVADEGEKEWVSYAMENEGKLDALWELMARDDVPVWVRVEDGGIGFEGTPAQQEVFARFLAMIDPDGAEGYLSGLSDEAWQRDAFFAQGRAFLDTTAAQAAIEAEMAARAAAHEQHAQALHEHARALEAELAARLGQQREVLAERRRVMERDAHSRAASVEAVLRRAVEMQNRAAEVEARAGTARTDAQRERLLQQAEELRAQAEAMREEAAEAHEELDEARAEMEEAIAEMAADEADARAELEEALAELRAELAEARAEMAEEAENCACTGACTGEGCADDCDEDCHCRTGAGPAAPARPARAATPAAPARPARAAQPAAPAAPASPRAIRD